MILVYGGDARQMYAAESLAEMHDVELFGFEELHIPKNVKPMSETTETGEKKADILVLPLPLSTDGENINMPNSEEKVAFSDVTKYVKPGGIIFGGKIDPKAKKIFEANGMTTIDYFEREELNVLNAVPTAEGAISLAMQEMGETIFGQNVLVTGFGRISKVLAAQLKTMGAKVNVAARKCSDLAWITIYGYNPVKMEYMDDKLDTYQLIFNTVPSMIFDRKKLIKISDKSLLIDLASKPGGVDMQAAQSLNLNVIWALSLPGKFAPVSAGRIIASTIENVLDELSGIENVC
jgi:dipicolinate synthase subunit A